MEDREGFFWFATPDKGISRYDGEFTTFDASNGLAHDQVYDIFEDSQGRLWFSTGGGLTLYDAETFTHFNTHHGLASNQLSTWPFSIAEDSRGYLYFATDSHGISRYDGEHFTTLDENDGLSGHRPTTLDVDGQGRVWIAAEKGISRYDDDVFTTFTTLDGLPDNAIGPISKDSKGHLWLGSMLKGISRYHGEMFTSLASPDGLEGSSILAFFDDSRGHMWISYMGKGVSRWDGEIFTTFSVEDGLAHNVVRSISEDTRGHMWFATSGGGISRYDGTVFQTLLATDGLADNAISRVLHRKNGETWIATSSGATRYRPNPTPPPIYLKNIVADRSYSALDSLRLPSSQKYLAFEFEGISFKTRPGQMAYLYRLKGYDDTWRQTRETQVEYSDLPVGRYTFEVKAVNRDLVYSQTPARVDVEVYYQPITSSIQIDDLVVQDLFVSFYKTYADLSIGSAHLSNNAPNAVEATLDFFVPDLMRRPSQQKFVLKPHSTQHVELYATLGEEILNLHSAKPLEAEVAVSCKIGEQTFSIEKTQTITVYGRGALTWDDLGRAAAFIIPEDESVSQFSRGLLENYRHLMAGRRVDGHIPKAMLLFEALNAHGIRYVSDASTPYAQVRGNASAVDNIQYPSELLESRMGDCDDCTVLYCSLLENLNISTALIDAPGHILMMFDAGVGEQRGYGFSLPNHLYIERDGRFWVPIEVTKLGEGSFLDAWELGAKTCQRLAASGGLRITDVHDAWSKYIYALPDATTEVALPIGETLKKSLLDNLRGLQQWRESFVDRTYVMPLLEDPLDNQRRLAFARTRLEAEYYNDAILQLSSLLNSPFKAEVLYLIGYSYAGQEDLSRAIRYIDQATQIAPDNYGYRRSLEILQAALD